MPPLEDAKPYFIPQEPRRGPLFVSSSKRRARLAARLRAFDITFMQELNIARVQQQFGPRQVVQNEMSQEELVDQALLQHIGRQ